MSNYFTDEDEAARILINKCLEGLDKEVQTEYLVNCLVLKHRQDKKVKEIFQAELIARRDFEVEFS